MISVGTRHPFLQFHLHLNVYTLDLYKVVEGLSGSDEMPVVKFLRYTQLNYKLFRYKQPLSTELCLQHIFREDTKMH